MSNSITAISEAFDDFQFEPERFIETGDKVVALLRARGRGKGSGVVVERSVAHVWTLDGRKPVRVEIYLDIAEGMKAAGLSE